MTDKELYEAKLSALDRIFTNKIENLQEHHDHKFRGLENSLNGLRALYERQQADHARQWDEIRRMQSKMYAVATVGGFVFVALTFFKAPIVAALFP